VFLHQIQAALQTQAFFLNPQNPQIALIVLPTGGGKTGVAVLSAYATNSSRVLVITPSEKVSDQIGKAFAESKKTSFLYQRNVVNDNLQTANVLPSFKVIKKRDCETDETLDLAFRNPLVVVNIQKVGRVGGRVALDDIPKNFDLVIVDEAHHYPARTWKAFVNHFQNSRRIFLTGTPKYRGGDILENQKSYLAYELERINAIKNGVIRDLEFAEEEDLPDDLNPATEEAACRAIVKKVKEKLTEHDRCNAGVFHQAMILAQTIQDLNSAAVFVREYNVGIVKVNEMAKAYCGNDSSTILNDFQGHNGISKKFRTLVVVGRLLEGFDHSPISVVGIFRNVSSRILFEQFVGRAVRRTGQNDLIIACIVSHRRFDQRANFNLIDTMGDEDPQDEE
jgi:superfamily II DNA or RNA helicase